MNKDLKVGDLIKSHPDLGIGLLVEIDELALERSFQRRPLWARWPYKVYWFKYGVVGSHDTESVNKVEMERK